MTCGADARVSLPRYTSRYPLTSPLPTSVTPREGRARACRTIVYSPVRDEFSLTPLPVNDTPYPPPYAEIDQNAPVPQTTPVTEQPRTQVITITTPTATDAALDSMRKVETCPYCNTTVTTLVIKENGLITHMLALLLFWTLPLIILYYMFGCCRYRNHYCPSCNRKIGYQYPEYCCIDTFHFDS
ncbi:LITAF-like zinc ribbon domain-containing protein [Phthorimaea operculella]|nr:LITAF-like zinc ribbon domain-containing protein [Phthorimaea operculella]